MRSQHPLSKAFPKLKDAAFQNLMRSIGKHGLLNPIVMYEDMVLDGYNREVACTLTPVKPVYINYTGDDPVGFVIAQNIERRHLSTAQRVELAAKLLEEATKRTKARESACKKGQPPTGDSPQDKSTAAEVVAKAVGVSARSVERRVAIKKRAVPEVVEAVASGEMSLSEGERVSKLPPRRQREEVKIPKAARKKAATTAKRGTRAAKESGTPTPEGSPAGESDLDALKRIWIHSTEETRHEFMLWIKGPSIPSHFHRPPP